MSAQGTYSCSVCGKACTAGVTDTIALLGLCREHATARYRRGMKARDEAERKAAET
jgi:hypothetical protein